MVFFSKKKNKWIKKHLDYVPRFNIKMSSTNTLKRQEKYFKWLIVIQTWKFNVRRIKYYFLIIISLYNINLYKLSSISKRNKVSKVLSIRTECLFYSLCIDYEVNY